MHLATLKKFRPTPLLLMLAACAISSVVVPALAQNAAQVEQLKAQMIDRFQQADTNKDGRLTKAETNGKMPRLHDNFEKVDSDGDGYVTQQDVVAYMQSIAGQRR